MVGILRLGFVFFVVYKEAAVNLLLRLHDLFYQLQRRA
jgi:hypothetical protein